MGPRHTTLGAAKTSFLRGIRLGGRQRPNRKKQKKSVRISCWCCVSFVTGID